MLDLVIVTPPDVPALSLDAAKAHLLVEHARDDDKIEDLVDAATGYLDGKDGVLGRALIGQTWRLYLDRFPACGRALRLPLPPLLGVGSIAYVDADGANQTWDASNYRVLTGERAEVELAYGANWPTTRCQARAVSVTFDAGYGSADTDLPKPLRQAIKFMLADLYANPETVAQGVSSSEIKSSVTVDRLIRAFRLPRT